MRNRILNVAGTGGWYRLAAADGFPRDVHTVSLQLREAQQDMRYRYTNDLTTYWTLRASTVRTIEFGSGIQPEELEIYAPEDTTVEVELSTQLTF